MKHSKKRLSPRKKPAQERAQQTVAVILEATARILSRDGILQLSTNRVAKEAGVSIGSLYQYFPGKEALLSALVQERLHADRSYFMQELAGYQNWPLKKQLHGLIKAGITRHRADRKILKVMFEQLSVSGQLDVAKQMNHQLYELILGLIGDIPQAPARGYIYVMTILGVWHSQVQNEWQYLDPDLLADLTTQILLRDIDASLLDAADRKEKG